MSDSHDHDEHIKAAVEFFKKEQVACVIHAGDIIRPPCLKLFEGLKLHGVLGNNDGEILGIMNAANLITAEI